MLFRSETQARELSEPNRRDIQVSAHTDTNTENLLAQIVDLKEQLAKSQAEDRDSEFPLHHH